MEVDSDVRRLFAVSGLEGYEKLRRENGELLATLTSMQARMTDRLKAFTGVSISEVTGTGGTLDKLSRNWKMQFCFDFLFLFVIANCVLENLGHL